MLVPVWITMLIAGVVALLFMVITPPKIDFILSRFAASSFLSTGAHLAIGGGWIADRLNDISGWLTGLVDDNIATLIGANAFAGLIAIAWTLFWLAAMLPDKWSGQQFDDRMIYSGIPLPFFVGIMPGETGEVLRTIIGGISDLATSLVTSVV